MTRHRYLKSKGWVKRIRYITFPTAGEKYSWYSPGLNEPYADLESAWGRQMFNEDKDVSWRPPQEIKTGRLKT